MVDRLHLRSSRIPLAPTKTSLLNPSTMWSSRLLFDLLVQLLSSVLHHRTLLIPRLLDLVLDMLIQSLPLLGQLFEILRIIETYTLTMSTKMLALFDSRYHALFMWPAVIYGSCLTEEALQQRLIRSMRGSRCQARHIYTACNALEILWGDPDPRAFGPYGLYRLKEKGLWISIL